MRIKKVDKETDEEKNYKLLLQSKILSGGFENHVLPQFSKKTIKKLQELTPITRDEKMSKFFSVEGVCNDETQYALSKDDETLF